MTPRTVDFLVIGGGVAGLSAGARLSSLGRVTVLEAEEAFGYHASGRSAALFEAQYGLPSTIELNRASEDYHRNAHGGVLSPRGLMLLGSHDDDERFSQDVVHMGLEKLTLDEARELIPILNPETVAFAAHHLSAWDIDTDRMLQNFARDIRKNGGMLETRARVQSVEHDKSGWRVIAGDTSYRATALVNAAGAWADKVAAMAGLAPIGLSPCRRSMARIPAPGGHDVAGWPMMLGVGETWYAKPDAGCLLVSPADETPVEPHDAWAEDLTLAEGIARYQRHVIPEVTRVLSSWAGLRTFSRDRCLVVGPDPNAPTFLWMAGQGGYGFQTAPAASQLLRDLVSGNASELPEATCEALSPARFR